MTRDQFLAIVDDISHFHEVGKPQEVLYFYVGENVRYEIAGWAWLNGGVPAVVILDLVGDFPPVYLPVQSISHISVRKK